MTPRPCPGCREPMQPRTLARKPMGEVDIDLCFACRGIWFDQYESLQLTPGAVIKLFGEIHAHAGEEMRPMPGTLRCPECSQALALTHDVQRTNKLVYRRCERGHGRFTPFMQFLREKNFVRSLSPGEIARLREHVRQVRCSSCGGSVNVERDAQCSYCQAPVAILDADAVKRTLEDLVQQEKGRTQYNPAAAVDGVLAGRRAERSPVRTAGGSSPSEWDAGMLDLVMDAIGFLIRQLR